MDGRLYPATALLGAAHGQQYPEIGTLSDSFRGLSETAAKLWERGFEVRELGDDREV